MAVWQFEFDAVPAALALVSGVPVIHLDPEMLNTVRLNLSEEREATLLAFLPQLLTEIVPWSNGMRIWGDEKSHDITAYLEAGRIQQLQIRMDASHPSEFLLRGLCELARTMGWVFVTRAGAVLQPNPEALARTTGTSPAGKWIEDPQAYLEAVASTDPDR